jgi:hypothetical protein
MARCEALFPLELYEGSIDAGKTLPKNQGFQDERSKLLLFLFPLFLLFLPFLLLEVLFLFPLFLFPFLFREGQGLHGGEAFGFLIKFRGLEAA